MTERFRVTAVLGIIQILTWGSSFYLLAVLGTPIVAETGWPAEAVAGGLSVALILAGLSARTVGRAIAARGGRIVMATGICVLMIGLLGVAVARSVPVYLMSWAVIGVGMAATLYDAAFSTLGTLFREHARGAITRLTLWGGFASTICWPLSAWMIDSFGWRGACLGYVVLHLCVALPLCLFGLPAARAKLDRQPQAGRITPDRRHWLLGVIAVGLTFIAAVLSVHLIPMLTASGFSLAAAVALGALIGPSQVGARLLEMLGRERNPPISTMYVSVGLVLLGLLALSLDLPAGPAIVAFGAGNGLYSIARGTVPLAAFGSDTYPQVVAFVARPALFSGALAPVAGATLIEQVGPQAAFYVLAGVAALALTATSILHVSLRTER